MVEEVERRLEVERGEHGVEGGAERAIANATPGRIPTTTVSAPLRRATWASARRAWHAKESSTSSAATSMITPGARYSPDLVEELRAEPEELAVVERGVEGRDEMPSVAEESRRAAVPAPCPRQRPASSDLMNLEPEETFGLLDTALQVADRVHLAQVETDGDQRQRDFRGQAGNDDTRAHQP